MKIKEVIDKLIEWHQPYDNPKTRDTIKFGNPDQECTGIVVTCYGSTEVIRRTKEMGCNLLISHESIFFGDEFDLNVFHDNKALEKKQKLLSETGIVVWRDHDHMHGQSKPWGPDRTRNDYIYYGLMKELGWEEYVIGDKMKPLLYKIPEITVKELAEYLMKMMNLNGIRIVGDTDATVSTIFICEHCTGRGDDEKINQAVHADVMIPLEINDWTMSAYVRDAVAFGEHKAILEAGHFNTEELGMKYMAEDWLPDVIDHAVPVYFVQSGDAFHYMLRNH